jgi:WD40 repeat protein
MTWLGMVFLTGVLPISTSSQPMAPAAQPRTKAAGPVAYESAIQPILARKCQVCHSGGLCQGDLDLGTYESLMRGGRRGKAIVAGSSKESLLIQLASKAHKPFMPPRGEEPLSRQELELLKSWVDQGAKKPLMPAVRRELRLGRLPEIVHPVHALAICSNPAVLAVGSAGMIKLYEARTGRYVRSMTSSRAPTKQGRQPAHQSVVEALAFSPDGQTLASAAFGEVITWAVGEGRPRWKFDSMAEQIMAVGFSPDGRYLACGGGQAAADGHIRILDAESGRLISDIPHAHSDMVLGVAFGPDSLKLASCGADRMIRVFAVPSGKLLRSLEGHTHHVLDVVWRPDGKWLASAGADQTVKLWDFEKGEGIRTLTGHVKAVTRLLFVQDGRTLLTCSGDQSVRTWDVGTGRAVRSIETGDYLCALAAGDSVMATGSETGSIRLYDTRTSQLLADLPPAGSLDK